MKEKYINIINSRDLAPALNKKLLGRHMDNANLNHL